MKTEKLGSEPAFPVTENIGLNGMSKRFYAACAAMQGVLSNPNTAKQIYATFGEVTSEQANQIICVTAYKMADELLKQENL
jgi:hypothetical protein